MKKSMMFPKSLFFYILAPMVSAAILVSISVMLILTPKLSSIFERQMVDDLDLAVHLGLSVCEENFLKLLDMRLSDNQMMRETLREESLKQIEEISERIQQISMLVVEEEGVIVTSTYPALKTGEVLDTGAFGSRDMFRQRIDSIEYLLQAEYFPFWRWYVVSLVPLQSAMRIVYLTRWIILMSLAAVLLLLVIILLVNLQFTIKNPLIRIISAAEEISRGGFPFLSTDRRDEIGKVTMAINRMSESLLRHSEKAEQALQQLSESEQRFRKIIENTQAGYFLLDPEGDLTDVNEAWLDLFGYETFKALLGKNISMVVAEEDGGRITTLLDQLRRGVSIPSGELKRINRDGSIGFCTFSISPVYRAHDLIGFEGFLIDITEQRRYQEALERSLEEKSVLLQEIHHRVKNNLNIVVSLLNLQSDNINDIHTARDALQASCNRIYSMALVHEKLYQSDDVAQIDLGVYINSIVSELLSIYANKLKIEMDLQVHDVAMDITRAIPCGLILNELITNSLVHAFNKRDHGSITIVFHSAGEGTWELLYEDDGVGYDAASDTLENSGSLGLTLIRILSEQLGGVALFEGNRGFRFRLSIPK